MGKKTYQIMCIVVTAICTGLCLYLGYTEYSLANSYKIAGKQPLLVLAEWVLVSGVVLAMCLATFRGVDYFRGHKRKKIWTFIEGTSLGLVALAAVMVPLIPVLENALYTGCVCALVVLFLILRTVGLIIDWKEKRKHKKHKSHHHHSEDGEHHHHSEDGEHHHHHSEDGEHHHHHSEDGEHHHHHHSEDGEHHRHHSETAE